jgi:Fic family protein
LEGTKRGLEYIYLLTEKKKKLDITPELITKLHEISFAWIFPSWGGKYRTIQVRFSDKEAPPYYQIPELITNFCRDAQERLRNLPKSDNEKYIFMVVSFLSWFQHRFVYIHPFQDYNGRTARMLTTLLLLSLNLPAVEIKADSPNDRKRYLTAMQQADEGNFEQLDKLIGQALTESLTRK